MGYKSMASPFLISVMCIFQLVTMSSAQMSREKRQLPLLVFPPTSPTRIQVIDAFLKILLPKTNDFTDHFWYWNTGCIGF